MIIYSSSQVMSNTLPQKNINLPTTVKSIQFRNVSAWSFHIVSSNSEWDILPFSSTIFPVSGNQNLSIVPLTQLTFTDINIPLGVSLDYMTQPIASVSSYSLLPIFTGNVNAVIQSGTVDANVTGTVDANIQNATIATSSTVVNESITTNAGYLLPITSWSLSSETSIVVPIPIIANQYNIFDVLAGKIWMTSASGDQYNVVLQAAIFNQGGYQLLESTNNGSITIQTGTSFNNLTGTDFYFPNPQPCNYLIVTISTTSGSTVTDNGSIQIVVDGNAVPVVNRTLGDNFYSFLQAGIGNGSSNFGLSLIGSAPGQAPMPTQLYTLDTSSTPQESKPISSSNPLPVEVENSPNVNVANDVSLNPSTHSIFTSVSSVAGGGSITPDSSITMSKIYGVWFSAGGNAGGVTRVTLSSGPWIAQVQTPNNNQWSVSTYHSEQAYMGVSTGYVTIENLYGDSADTVYYDLKIEYDP